ncbi:MAG: class A beta-lactamase-related serine hydrolase [Brevundimonas sp.]|nr:MAG: class A beta-lactamase-related serine hydrolase [Brevundimonas sp.]
MTVQLDRRSLLAAGLGLAAAAASGPAGARAPSPGYDAALDAAFAERSPIALGGAVVTADGVAWSGVRGVRRFGEPDPVGLEDKWHLGSNAKAMTAAVYGRLVDQGRARWDAFVPEIFTDIPVDPAWADIRIVDLMHHRAGLGDASVLSRDWLMSARRDPASLVDQRTALAARAFAAPPTGTPGTFAYGNADYVMIGAAIERLTRASWEAAMATELFAPLGLASAGFGAPRQNASGGPNAWGHMAPQPPFTPMDPASPGADNPLAMSPAGGVHMTLSDYGRFLQALIRDGEGWLKPETVRALATPPAEGEPYAGGWGVRRDEAGDSVLGHDGSNTLWHVTASLNLGTGVGLIGAANQSPQNGAPRTLVQGLRTASAV